jgi:hypothetical protein
LGAITFAMTLENAEKIVHEYGAVLATESATDGPASYASRLPHSPERIVQAMKLWLAHDIQNRSLTQEFRNEIGTAASRLPYFIEDAKAHRLNTTRRSFSPAARAGLAREDFIARAKAVREVDEWATSAAIAGLSLRGELSEFIAAVEQFDPADSLYWQSVYTLAKLEHSPTRKSTETFVPKNYKVARNGVEIGEFEPFDFFEGVHHGKIRQDDWFWMEGMSAWKRVSDLKILANSEPTPGRTSGRARSKIVSWFRRKPTQQKYLDAAITVATNLYLHTIPEAEDAPAPLQFSLPDSRSRYMIFSLSTVITAALAYDEKKHIQPEALIKGCLHAVNLIATKDAQEYLGGPASSQDSVENASAYLTEFLKHWSRWPELEKEGRNDEIIDLISSMIHTTESNLPAEKTDMQRLDKLALQIFCQLPTMRRAFIELANR